MVSLVQTDLHPGCLRRIPQGVVEEQRERVDDRAHGTSGHRGVGLLVLDPFELVQMSHGGPHHVGQRGIRPAAGQLAAAEHHVALGGEKQLLPVAVDGHQGFVRVVTGVLPDSGADLPAQPGRDGDQ